MPVSCSHDQTNYDNYADYINYRVFYLTGKKSRNRYREKLVPEKYWYRYRKYLVPEKSIGIGIV